MVDCKHEYEDTFERIEEDEWYKRCKKCKRSQDEIEGRCFSCKKPFKQPSPPAAWSEEQIHFVATFKLKQGMAKYITMGEHNARSLLSSLSRPETGGQPEQSEEFLKYLTDAIEETPDECDYEEEKLLGNALKGIFNKYKKTHQKPRPAEKKGEKE
jgi:hypothetical protein